MFPRKLSKLAKSSEAAYITTVAGGDECEIRVIVTERPRDIDNSLNHVAKDAGAVTAHTSEGNSRSDHDDDR